jgi:hypothetical protein
LLDVSGKGERMKKAEWRNGNHMKFESLHKTFNRQVDMISTGNVMGGVQFSGYIRPRNETVMPDGETPCDRGRLQEWDLTTWHSNLPLHIRDWVRTNPYCEHRNIIMYEIRHWVGPSWKQSKIVHGYIATTGHTEGYKLLGTWITGNTYKSESVIAEAIKYVADGPILGVSAT